MAVESRRHTMLLSPPGRRLPLERVMSEQAWLPSRGASLHYGWIVLGAAFVGMSCAAGIRYSFGAFIRPWEAKFGWTRDSISYVGSLSLLVWGVAPLIVGYLVDHYGPRHPRRRVARRRGQRS